MASGVYGLATGYVDQRVRTLMATGNPVLHCPGMPLAMQRPSGLRYSMSLLKYMRALGALHASTGVGRAVPSMLSTGEQVVASSPLTHHRVLHGHSHLRTTCVGACIYEEYILLWTHR